MGNMSGSYGSHYTLWQSITQNSQNINNNTTNVTVRMYLSFDGSSFYAFINASTSGNMNINGANYNYSVGSINFSSGQAKDLLLAEWTGDIEHNADGTKTLEVSGSWDTNTSRIGSGSCSNSQVLNPIGRYATITSFNVSNISGADGLTKVKLNWQANAPCDYAWYSIDNGNSWLDLPKTDIIFGLQPNTQYNFKLRVRRTDSQLLTVSQTVTKSTYDISKISSVNNFEHGDNVSVNITNPAGISDLNLVLKIGEIQILNRTVTTGNNTIEFTDDELDNLYKEYGVESSLMATFILSGGGYTNSKTCTINLTGNQKTARIKNNDSFKRAKIFLNVNGSYKRAVAWININGTWKRSL